MTPIEAMAAMDSGVPTAVSSCTSFVDSYPQLSQRSTQPVTPGSRTRLQGAVTQRVRTGNVGVAHAMAAVAIGGILVVLGFGGLGTGVGALIMLGAGVLCALGGGRRLRDAHDGKPQILMTDQGIWLGELNPFVEWSNIKSIDLKCIPGGGVDDVIVTLRNRVEGFRTYTIQAAPLADSGAILAANMLYHCQQYAGWSTSRKIAYRV